MNGDRSDTAINVIATASRASSRTAGHLAAVAECAGPLPGLAHGCCGGVCVCVWGLFLP